MEKISAGILTNFLKFSFEQTFNEIFDQFIKTLPT